MYNRLISDIFPPKYSSFLFGPRQCGKSTVLSGIKSELFIDLLDREEFLQYNADPGLLYRRVKALKSHAGYVIIDEIQKVPALLDEVQRCIDQYSNLYFLLSGSSARKLKSGAANLLGGRALYNILQPLTARELGTDFSLDNVLAYGSLPKICLLLKAGETVLVNNILKSYVVTYLNEEIKAEALVRNLESFQRFLDIAAFQYSQEVNLSYISNESQISIHTVKSYYSILEDTLIGFFLYPWATSIRKELAKTPKFYLFDNGVTRAIQGLLGVKPAHQERGRLFEQWVVNEVYRLNAYLEKDFKLNFWKTVHGAEVDLIISRGGKPLLALECKATRNPAARDLSGLRSFHEEYPKVPAYICAAVNNRVVVKDDYLAIPPNELFEIVANL